MNELYTKYLGLDLRSPLIAGSCNLTDNLENLKEIEKAGAGAVVLKSVFEEEIYLEYASEFNKLGPMENNLEFLDYYDVEIRHDNLKRYLDFIAAAKASLHIPVIASINCVTSQEWSFFAQKIEAAGADAIELNLFILPSDLRQSSNDNEKTYFDIISRVSGKVKIPVSVKISPYFSNLGRMIHEISASGIRGMVLFNRFYSPDIDIDKEVVKSAPKLSSPGDYRLPLRWIGMMAHRVECDLAASTGVHDWETAVRLLLAGAQTIQLVSILYKEGFQAISHFNNHIASWMESKKYDSINDFRGKLALGTDVNPAEYERVQFMKTFAEYK